MYKYSNIKGLSLIEISLVVVIIAVLMTVVYAGQGLLQQFKTNNAIAEFSYYTKAHSTFRQKYKYRPGDLPSSLSSKIFNNYGDDICGESDFGNFKWDNDTEEDLVWLQLSELKLIRQHIYFNPCSVTGGRIPGEHRPLSDSIQRAGYTYLQSVTETHDSTDYQFLYVLRQGVTDPTDSSDTRLQGGKMTVSQHIAIDSKIDKPNTPLSGSYFVSSECVRTDNGEQVYIFEDSPELCTGNYAEVSSDETRSTYSP